MLRRILSSGKIVKVEGRKTSSLDFYAETYPFFWKDSERRGENKISKLVADIFYPETHPVLFKDNER